MQPSPGLALAQTWLDTHPMLPNRASTTEHLYLLLHLQSAYDWGDSPRVHSNTGEFALNHVAALCIPGTAIEASSGKVQNQHGIVYCLRDALSNAKWDKVQEFLSVFIVCSSINDNDQLPDAVVYVAQTDLACAALVHQAIANKEIPDVDLSVAKDVYENLQQALLDRLGYFWDDLDRFLQLSRELTIWFAIQQINRVNQPMYVSVDTFIKDMDLVCTRHAACLVAKMMQIIPRDEQTLVRGIAMQCDYPNNPTFHSEIKNMERIFDTHYVVIPAGPHNALLSLQPLIDRHAVLVGETRLPIIKTVSFPARTFILREFLDIWSYDDPMDHILDQILYARD